MRYIFTLLITVAYLISSAQTVPVTGNVTAGTDGTSVAGATILFQSRTDSLNKQILLTDSTGSFTAKAIAGLYKLQITNVGFLPVDTLIIVADVPKNLGTIQMMKNEGLMGEVVVKAALPPVKQKGDTVEYSS